MGTGLLLLSVSWSFRTGPNTVVKLKVDWLLKCQLSLTWHLVAVRRLVLRSLTINLAVISLNLYVLTHSGLFWGSTPLPSPPALTKSWHMLRY